MPQKPYRALITGASRGIGREITIALAPHCETLFLLARHRKDLEAIRDTLPCKQVVILDGDLTDNAFLHQVSASVEKHGGINLLVNNAGTSEFIEFDQQSSHSIDQLINLNINSVVRLSQILLPNLRKEAAKGQRCQMINIGSSFAYIGYPGFAVYCATKYAIRGFTQALDRELYGTGIAVRLFSPRATQTELNSEAVRSLNHDLGVQEDHPRDVAREFLRFCGERRVAQCVGFPEKFFAAINQVLPGIVSGAIRKQLPRIRQAFKNA
ncbi:MAG: SDR family oxidoreductase [Burkholderiaceae bacterium]|nr:SDR family oxidoreductase [Burkholderiaceae bacterium]